MTNGMNCSDVRYLLSLYVDGELYPDDAMAVREHLGTCRDCRAIYDEYRADQQLLTRFARSAPYLPVADAVRDQVRHRGRQRWRGWSVLAAGGHRVAAGVAVAALLTFVLVSGLVLREMGLNSVSEPTPDAQAAMRSGFSPPESPEASTMAGFGAATPSVESASSVIEALENAGLVFPVGGADGVDAKVDTVSVRVLQLAFDRGVTYLIYSAPEYRVLPATLVDDQDTEYKPYAAGPVAGPTQGSASGSGSDGVLSWLVFRGLNPSNKSVTVHIQSIDKTTGPLEIEVPVDLSRFRGADGLELPIGVENVMAGVKIDQAVITRGIVVSTLAMKATVVDRNAIEYGEMHHGLVPEVAVNLDAQPVQIAGMGTTDTSSRDTVTIVANLFNLNSNGILSVTIDSIPIADQSQGVAQGPWTLKSALANTSAPAATPTAGTRQPQPTTAVPTAAARPTQAPTRTTQPTPTPNRQPIPKLPSDLYFLAQGDADGMNAVWIQPADGSTARIVAYASGGISNYWLAAGNSIAYKPINEDKVYLVSSDGQLRGEARMPDGRSVVEYVPSPDGGSIAYVTTDFASLWVSDADGRNLRRIYQVTRPDQQSVHQIEWSANSRSIAFQELRPSAGSRTMVVDAASGTLLWNPNDVPIDLALSRDGSQLFYATYNGVFVVDLSSGTERNITPAALRSGGQQLITNLAVLQDGTIAFTQRGNLEQDQTVMQPAQLWTMNADGSNPALVRNDLGPVQDWAWIASEGGYGFAVGLVEGQSAESKTPAALHFYRGAQTAPETLATGIGTRAFSSLQWRAAR